MTFYHSLLLSLSLQTRNIITDEDDPNYNDYPAYSQMLEYAHTGNLDALHNCTYAHIAQAMLGNYDRNDNNWRLAVGIYDWKLNLVNTCLLRRKLAERDARGLARELVRLNVLNAPTSKGLNLQMAGYLRQGLRSARLGDTQNDWLMQWTFLDVFVDWIKDDPDNDEYSDDDDNNNACDDDDDDDCDSD